MRRNTRSNVLLGTIVVAALALLWWGNRGTNPGTPPANVDPSKLIGMNTGTAPWPPELVNLRDRLAAIGLPALHEEGNALHIHQHVDIFVDGNSLPVPAGIGTGPGFISPVHTHDPTGIIHVESPTVQTFTLGQFFDIWGVRFTTDCLGGYCTSAEKLLKVYVNGILASGDPRQLALEAHQEIAIVYGQAPVQIPSSYLFPDGD